MKQKSRILLGFLVLVLINWIGIPFTVSAANASATFGSNWYEKTEQDTFPVKIYLRSDYGTLGYSMTLHYDPAYLSYVSGASSADIENGVLHFSGDSGSAKIEYRLVFKAIKHGETSLKLDAAEAVVPPSITDVSGNVINIAEANQMYVITTLGTAPVRIKELENDVSGNDVSGNNIQPPVMPQESEGQEPPVPPDESTPQQETDTSQEAIESEPIPETTANTEIQDEHKEVILDTSNESNIPAKAPVFYNMYVAAILIVVGLTVLIALVIYLIRRLTGKNKGHKEKKISKEIKMDNHESDEDESGSGLTIYDFNEDEDALLMEEELHKNCGTPIIKIDDVTMEFHLSSSNPSGLKDYLIQMIKRQITYRRLFALYHVSFNVYKGEIVGIIGTNGSGKSTLLKIVSGALKPTGGHVEIDKKKVQLLTLGTGFDMELTARENVYLNGSIIGYSREFIDAVYDEIVEFAELSDFMEEKVKNFSSGMVSRLGFSIATAGDAAEILILDEVLSVGDEFFRKKSLARVKEMIHGGSTVLLVSHSMNTILDNCTKVVWIEKGKLQMVGEPKAVCEAYRKNDKHD